MDMFNTSTLAAMHIAYMTSEDARWLVRNLPELVGPKHGDMTEHGNGIAAWDETTMRLLRRLGRITEVTPLFGDRWNKIRLASAEYNVITVDRDPNTAMTVLAIMVAALPSMPLEAQVRLSRELAVQAPTLISQHADAAVVELVAQHRGQNAYAAVAHMLGVSESTINKAVTSHNTLMRQR